MKIGPVLAIAILGVGGIYFLTRSSAGAGGALPYAASWKEAREEARKSSRPILLNFGGPW